MPDVTRAEMLDHLASIRTKAKSAVLFVPNYAQYPLLTRLITGKHFRDAPGGSYAQFIAVKPVNRARNKGYFAKDTTSESNITAKATAELKFRDIHWVQSTDALLQNKSSAREFDFAVMKENELAQGKADKMEADLLGAPTTDADDAGPAGSVRGIQYHVPKFDSGQAGAGFYGGHVGTCTSWQGIARCTSSGNTTSITGDYTKVRSYEAGGTNYYDDWDDTLLDTFVRSFLAVRAVPPPDMTWATRQSWQTLVISNQDSVVGLTKVMRQQSEDMRGNLTQMGPQIYSTPIDYEPLLDSDTDDTIYILDMNTLVVLTEEGGALSPASPKVYSDFAADSHTTINHFEDWHYEMWCDDPSRQAAISKAD